MNSFFLIFCIFSTFAALSAGLVVISKNPVFSVLFLITTFCNVAILLFLLNLDFLPVTFIIVYVGAIAVLFLFVIMMLNIKVAELKDESLHLVAGILLFVIIFVAEIFTGSPGKYVGLQDGIDGFNQILDGKYDDPPEQAFYLVGDMAEVIAKAEKINNK